MKGTQRLSYQVSRTMAAGQRGEKSWVTRSAGDGVMRMGLYKSIYKNGQSE